MAESPDIGKMIDEELAKGGAPEASKPLEMQGGRIIETAPQAGEPAPAADKRGGKKELWQKEHDKLGADFAALHGERKTREKPAKDDLTAAELDELRAIIAQAAKENDKTSTAVLKEGINVSDESTLHPYDKGLESISAKLLEPGTEFQRQALLLLNNQEDGDAAIKALLKSLPERIEKLSKATAQKKQLRVGAAELPKPAAAEMPKMKPKEQDAEEKRAVVGEAMKPFYDDVQRMLEGDRRKKEREAKERGEEPKKQSWWDKWFGGKKAA